MSARITPEMPPFSKDIADALARIMPPGVPPLILFTTLARNPRVFQRVIAGGLLDKGSISLRERELVIDRTTARCSSEYEWGVHIAFFAEHAGLTPAEIAAIVHGAPDDPLWQPRERLILRLVDCLHETNTIHETLWAALKTEFSDEQLIELVVLTGFYHTISFVTNALAIPLEESAARFAAYQPSSASNAS
jgi:alkylhydroperoxidase family enzyme